MKIIVTGADGFIGQNLCCKLKENGFSDLVPITRSTSKKELSNSLKESDLIFHLAGSNRPEMIEDFIRDNTELTDFIINELVSHEKRTTIIFSSSIQANFDNPYGKSKYKAEESIINYGKITQAKYYIFRFPNIFGKWSRPNYNSFVATFCHNTLNNLEIKIHDPNASISLAYIDDVCDQLCKLTNSKTKSGFRSLETVYETTVGKVAELISSFHTQRNNLYVEEVGEGLERALYATFLSFMNPEHFSYKIKDYADTRGSFSEVLKTKSSGQLSYFTVNPGATRGGHYHHTKNEKFVVLKGKALFRFRHIITNELLEMTINSPTEIIDTIPGWAHDITNLGDEEMIVMLWANECFDPLKPDTYNYQLN